MLLQVHKTKVALGRCFLLTQSGKTESSSCPGVILRVRLVSCPSTCTQCWAWQIGWARLLKRPRSLVSLLPPAGPVAPFAPFPKPAGTFLSCGPVADLRRAWHLRVRLAA